MTGGPTRLQMSSARSVAPPLSPLNLAQILLLLVREPEDAVRAAWSCKRWHSLALGSGELKKRLGGHYYEVRRTHRHA